MQPLEYAVTGLDLDQKTILDAAVGAGRATAFWAEKLSGDRASSRIIGVDIDLPKEWRRRIKERLGENMKYVELVEGDIFNLDFLANESIDIVSCADTIIFLNDKPLRFLQALQEFKRVLVPGGDLIITSEYSSEDMGPGEGQWHRWRLSKCIFELIGKTWSVEPEPREVKKALEILGFDITGERDFPAVKIKNYGETMDEWKNSMQEKVKEMAWSEEFRKTIAAEVNKVYEQVLDEGYLLGPAKYIIKARKKLAGRSGMLWETGLK